MNATQNHLQGAFADALRDAGMRSWLGDRSTNWMSPRWGDVFPHETLIAHIRRLLATEFACNRLNETHAQFRKRLDAVERRLNDNWGEGGTGLLRLAKSMRGRCAEVVRRKGERIPK